jgi:hypothetical protein
MQVFNKEFEHKKKIKAAYNFMQEIHLTARQYYISNRVEPDCIMLTQQEIDLLVFALINSGDYKSEDFEDTEFSFDGMKVIIV